MAWGVTTDIDVAVTQLQSLANRQLDFAASRALNDTAEQVRKAEIMEMQRVFDRPTPWTLNAFQIKPATKGNLVAVVEEKPAVGRRDYLYREAAGGARRSTAVETLLRHKLPYEGLIAAILPADNARLDQYGNWSTGQRNEVLSAIGAMRDSTSNRTARSLGRKKNPSKFFIPTSGLAPAIYERTASGRLKVILAFAKSAPVYTPRFHFEAVAFGTAKAALATSFPKRLAEAMASAR
jgi:hypothetical protein